MTVPVKQNIDDRQSSGLITEDKLQQTGTCRPDLTSELSKVRRKKNWFDWFEECVDSFIRY